MLNVEDDDFTAVCRDETCHIAYVHPSHVFPIGQSKRPKRPWFLCTEPGAHLRPDPKGLHLIIKGMFGATDWPLAFVDVLQAVLNDYGSASKRTIHRHIARLVEEKYVLALDLELDFAYLAYIRHDSRYLHDRENLRDHMSGKYVPAARRRRMEIEQIAAFTDRAI